MSTILPIGTTVCQACRQSPSSASADALIQLLAPLVAAGLSLLGGALLLGLFRLLGIWTEPEEAEPFEDGSRGMRADWP